ncbi:DnaJ domain-containing protein [Myxococcota bacterium]|nr:DnaJ domain-containing protein [Myxococcota bacterium]
MLTRDQALKHLGLKAPASEREIRAAYRQLAQRFHPDRVGENARFTEITAAYNALLRGDVKAADATPKPRPATRAARPEPIQRADVEAWRAWRRKAERLHAERSQGMSPPSTPSVAAPSSPSSPPPSPTPPSEGVKVAERIARPPGLLSRIKAGLKRFGGLRLEGRDEVMRLPVSGEVVLTGAQQRIGVQRKAACVACASDQARGEACAVCEGQRRIKLREEIRVYIPPGAREGVKLRLNGKGTAGLDGHPDGDLYLLLEPQPIEGFERQDADLYGALEIPPHVALQGGEISAAGPRGALRVRVPKGSQVGDLLKIKGEGLPTWGGGAVGDLFFEITGLTPPP